MAERRALCAVSLALLLVLIIPLYSQKASSKSLPEKYRKWLEEEVVYIITPIERDVFLQLKTDRERDLFIDAFWNHRNPTPGAPDNAFKTEHMRRLQYANTVLARGASRPGWMTDRGRIYILLGEPRDIERFVGESEIYNAEIWFYEGLTNLGLPTGFNLMFYQKNGVGDYVLYSPLNDGPQALLPRFMGSQGDYVQAYKYLKQLQPTLANTAISLLPGESNPFGQPSLSSDLLIQSVYSTPQRQFKDSYAEKFLLYKDTVEVDYSANYIDSDSLIAVLRDPSGMYFVNYLLEMKKFSVAQAEGKYSTQFLVNGHVTDAKGKSIFQFENSFPIRLSEDELKKVTYNPFDIYDMFPLIPGEYKVSIPVKNEVSKEFTSLEKMVVVPESEAAPRLSPLLLGYKTTSEAPGTEKAAKLMPFKFGPERIYLQPRSMFLSTDTMSLAFQTLGLNEALRKSARFRFEILKGEEIALSQEKNVADYGTDPNFVEDLPMVKLAPAYYRVRVTLLDRGNPVSTAEERFEVTSVASFPRPWVYSRSLTVSPESVYPLLLGTQYLSAGNKAKAREELERAYLNRPKSYRYVLSLARGFFELGELRRTIELLQPFIPTETQSYDLLFLLGMSYQGEGDFGQALTFYQKATSQFGINLPLLNNSGECHFRLGQKEEAAAAWKKSLEINANQPEIKAKLDSLKK